ncbi:MAG TPA: hydrogenase iron-sulfur subunit, partial [Deinococcales bacterium]|nr:hydrogenase iron-sulfur subunit [Deinococcales bacterium]
MTTTTTTPTPAPAAARSASPARPKLLGFVCEWSVGRTSLIDDDGRVRGLEHVRTVKIPCSGFVKPEWVQLGFESGAQGVFVLGCPLGDCHFNEGNYIISERLVQLRKRLTGRKLIDDETRVAELYLGVSEGEDFLSVVQRFSDYITGLPELAPPKKTGRAARAEA